MKYHLTEDWLEYKKGHVFDGVPRLSYRGDESYQDYKSVSPALLSLLLKTGILEEVKEEEWPKVGDIYWRVSNDGGDVYSERWDDYPHEIGLKAFGNVFCSETEAKEASEKIKTLLLSLKK